MLNRLLLTFIVVFYSNAADYRQQLVFSSVSDERGESRCSLMEKGQLYHRTGAEYRDEYVPEVRIAISDEDLSRLEMQQVSIVPEQVTLARVTMRVAELFKRLFVTDK
jgi:hypothetical protein